MKRRDAVPEGRSDAGPERCGVEEDHRSEPEDESERGGPSLPDHDLPSFSFKYSPTRIDAG